MLIIQQSKYDLALLAVVVLLCIAANLPAGVAPIDNRVLIVSLAIILAISMVRYVRISLVLVTVLLVVGANLPGELAAHFGISKNILLFTLAGMVIVAIVNHYLKAVPSGDEPEHVARSLYGAKALFTAVMKGNVEVVQSLIQSGVNVNVRTLTGKTPLMAASYKGYVDIVQMLLNAGTNPNARDAEGNTSLSIARHMGFSRIVAFLKMGGAEENSEFLDVAHLTNSPTAELKSHKVRAVSS